MSDPIVERLRWYASSGCERHMGRWTDKDESIYQKHIKEQ